MKGTNYIHIFSLFIVIILIASNNLYSQDTLSLPAVQFGSMVTDGQYLYMFGGVADNANTPNVLKKQSAQLSIFLNSLSRFAPDGNIWGDEETDYEEKPDARTYQKAAVDSKTNSILIFGGTSGAGILNDIWKYDLAKKVWTKIDIQGILPPARLMPSVNSVKDGVVMVGGKGTQGEYVGDCWFFNSQTSTWEQKTSPPKEVEFDGHQAVSVNDYEVGFWGGDNNPNVNDFWIYNTQNGNWEKHTIGGTGPQNKRGGCIMEKIGSKAYMGGGTENYLTKLDDFYSIDLTTWQWTKLIDMPAKLYAASSSVLDSKLYVYGGNDDTGKRSNKVYMYDPTKNTWEEKNPVRVYPCKPPTNLTAQMNKNKPELNWNDNSTVENGYKVERKTSTENWSIIYTSAPDAKTYSDESAETGKQYFYRVCAYNFTGNSDYSNEMNITVTDISKENLVPTNFALYQNYPNPFNPETHIEFDLPSSERVTLKIYDLLGKEIKTLIAKELIAGKHKVKFDGGNLASGIYLYKIVSENYSEARKMILLQ